MIKTNTQKITCYVPKSVDLSSLNTKHIIFLTKLTSIIPIENLDLDLNAIDTNYIRREERAPYEWNNLSSKYLRKIVGPDYAQIINDLVDRGDIEVYSKDENIKGGSYGPGAYFKAYRFTEKHRGDIAVKNFNQQVLIAVKKKYFRNVKKTNVLTDKALNNISKNPELQKIVDNLREVTVHDSWQDDLEGKVCIDGISYLSGKAFYHNVSKIEQICTGNINTLSIGDNNRVFHPVICMSRAARKFLRYQNKKNKFVLIDVKSCHPTLLTQFISGKEEQKKWLHACNDLDIYTELNPDPSKYTRDDMKMLYQRLISVNKDRSKQTNKRGDVGIVFSILHRKFPGAARALQEIWNNYREGGINPQSIFQQLESEIFVEYWKQSNHFTLPMHDGLLCLKRDKDIVLQEIIDYSEKVLGYKLIVTIKDL